MKKLTISFLFALSAMALILAACAPAATPATEQPASSQPQTTNDTSSTDYTLDQGSEMRFLDSSGNYVIIVNHGTDGTFSVEKRMSTRKDKCWLDVSRDNGSVCNVFGSERCIVNDGVKAHKMADSTQLTITTVLKPIQQGEFCYDGG